jgi:subtilase family serine protease
LCKEYRLNKNAVSRIEGGHPYYRMSNFFSYNLTNTLITSNMLNISIKVDLIYVLVFNFKTTVNKMPKKTREEILKLLSENKYELKNRFKVHRMALLAHMLVEIRKLKVMWTF